MHTFLLKEAELNQIRMMLPAICESLRYTIPANDPLFFNTLAIHAHRLPERLILFLNDFKYNEGQEGLCMIKGLHIDDARIKETPSHWRDEEAEKRTSEEAVFLLLCSALLGDAIGWSTQQDGKIVHNIVPIKGDEHKQVGSSTLTKLWWHTEEAFHPCRCDYLGLLCLRNMEQVATSFASVASLDISPRDKEKLFEHHYFIYPDSSHLDINSNGKTDFSGVARLNEQPVKVPVLFGDYNAPYLCIDPFYMDMEMEDKPALSALHNLINEIDRNLKRVVLQPGDVLFLDNYRVVHGRDPYVAKFDGQGRWLKRVNIVRDLRKSRKLRIHSGSRIIETA